MSEISKLAEAFEVKSKKEAKRIEQIAESEFRELESFLKMRSSESKKSIESAIQDLLSSTYHKNRVAGLMAITSFTLGMIVMLLISLGAWKLTTDYELIRSMVNGQGERYIECKTVVTEDDGKQYCNI